MRQTNHLTGKILSAPIAIGALVILIAVGVYLALYIRQTNQTASPVSATPTSSVTNQTTPETPDSSDTSDTKDTSDETADWLTYSNPEAVFTFKYPNGWYIYGDKGQQRIYIQTQEGEVDKTTIGDDFQRVWISYKSDESSLSQETETSKIAAVEKSTINAGSVKITLYQWTANGIKKAKAYWSDGNSRYSSENAIETGTEQEEIEILRQILSTFKFTP